MWAPLVARYPSKHYSISCHVLASMSGVTVTEYSLPKMVHILNFLRTHEILSPEEMSNGVVPEFLGGQGIRPSLTIQLLTNRIPSSFRTRKQK